MVHTDNINNLIHNGISYVTNTKRTLTVHLPHCESTRRPSVKRQNQTKELL